MTEFNMNNIPELLPFKDDYIFKSALTKPNAGIVRNSMLTAFTGIEIVESTISENEPPIDVSAWEKPIRFDVNCKTSDGKQVNIEMQANSMVGDNQANLHENLRHRTVYYESKLFASQPNPAKYADLKQTFQIMLCDFTIYDDEDFITKFCFSKGEKVLSDKSCVILVELPKIKSFADCPLEEMTPEQQWAFYIEYFDNENYREKILEFLRKEEFKMADTILSNISKNDEERYRYISRLKFETDLSHNLTVSKEEGMLLKAIQTAKNFLQMGLTVEQVAKGTELPIEEVKKLKP